MAKKVGLKTSAKRMVRMVVFRTRNCRLITCLLLPTVAMVMDAWFSTETWPVAKVLRGCNSYSTSSPRVKSVGFVWYRWRDDVDAIEMKRKGAHKIFENYQK